MSPLTRVTAARLEACARRGEPPPVPVYKPHLRMRCFIHPTGTPFYSLFHVFSHHERGRLEVHRLVTIALPKLSPACWRDARIKTEYVPRARKL